VPRSETQVQRDLKIKGCPARKNPALKKRGCVAGRRAWIDGLKALDWILQIHTTHPVAHAIGVLALVCVAGMAAGSLKVRGVGLGTSGVLFAGILTGYFSKPVDHTTLEFVKEFGLILFVFTIGLQLGPGCDVIRVRTNYRREQLYLYRTSIKPDRARSLFIDYLRTVDALHLRPRFYNALTSNCTTNGHIPRLRPQNLLPGIGECC
jgi:hypothetical protein